MAAARARWADTASCSAAREAGVRARKARGVGGGGCSGRGVQVALDLGVGVEDADDNLGVARECGYISLKVIGTKTIT